MLLFNHSYIDVILPLGVPNLYTYRVPEELNEQIGIGYRVVVQFGKSKLYSAIIQNIHTVAPKAYQAKDIQMVLDEKPVVNLNQLKLWDWIKTYYMCHPGDVMSAALPSGLKLSSETQVLLNNEIEIEESILTDDEFLIYEALEISQVLSLDEISKILNRKTVYPIVKMMLERNVIVVLEEIKSKFKPKKEKYVTLKATYQEEEKLKGLFDSLMKAPKQLAILMKYIELSQMFSGNQVPVKQKVLLQASDAASSQLNALVKKEVFKVNEITIGRLGNFTNQENKEFKLSERQEEAFLDIKKQFESKRVVLLHGVTSSGKTEIYTKLIEETINQGKRVLYLLPEIALTTQIINRLRRYFGDRVGVYHSRFNQNERVEIWNKQLSSESYDIILGARSALFLPFDNLGLVVIDEEHDSSFKQFEPSPRYNARDSAVVLANMFEAKVLMGSATPAIETMNNAKSGKYGLVSISERFGGVQMPKIVVSDLARAQKMKKMHGHFSFQLMEEIKAALDRKEQVILFQNRRGFSPYIICQSCGWTPYCTRCDVGLTYHKYLHRLKCHYCGFERHIVKKCEACGSHEVELSGFGTEKIEEDMSLIYPEAKVARMDLETTRSKNAYQNIITDFEDKKIDILVGTQMVTKGLDFENVSLVGVLNADQSLNFQDFRAHERSYQLMSQVAGRAGRNTKQGLVVIQTYQPDHPIIQQVIKGDYFGMYERELELRKEFEYPPFHKLIKVVLKHANKDKLVDSAQMFADVLKSSFGSRVLGPEFPGVPRVRNKYINQIFLKVEDVASIKSVKDIVTDSIYSFRQNKEYRPVQILIDVDPY
ncbi:MAG: replication restart helicase PriA [Salibacteraceae bacterium]